VVDSSTLFRALRGAALILGALQSLCSARLDANLDVQVRLHLDGKDVTPAHSNALVRFLPHSKGPDGKVLEEVRCLVKEICSVPAGAWGVDLDAESVIVETRPRLFVEKDERDSTFISLSLAPAAYVSVSGVPEGGMLQALDRKLATLHSRKVVGSLARLRIPARPVILCAYDPNTRPLACWPVNAAPGKTVSLPGFPRLAKGRGQLSVDFEYASRDAPHDLAVALRVGETVLRPDEVVSAHPDRHFAVWYDVPSGTGTLEVTSRYWSLGVAGLVEVPDRDLLVRRAIPLLRRPTLKVRLLGSERLEAGDVEVDLLACEKLVDLATAPPLGLCSQTALQKGTPGGTFTFPNLSPKAYALRWRKGPLHAVRWVDLRDGQSRDEEIPIEVTEVRGRVTRRGQGYAARLVFAAPNADERTKAEADAEGNYQVLVAQPGEYSVVIRDERGRDFDQRCAVATDRPENSCDFDLPANAVVVRVGTEDGAPLPDSARVSFDLKAPPPRSATITFGYGLALDRDGSVLLPPLPNGFLFVEGQAEGYRVTSAGAPLEITNDLGISEVPVILRKGSGIRLRIVDPAGRPATQARIWSGPYGAIADGSGIAAFDNPLSAGSPLVAYDAAGRMLFTRYSGNEEDTLRIPQSAPPFRIHLQYPDGAPVSGGVVLVSVDGILDDKRFVDQALLAGGDHASGSDGDLRVAGLPSMGLLTVFPFGRPDLAVLRTLPVREAITITLPLPENPASPQ
jgi:hypothetical protein